MAREKLKTRPPREKLLGMSPSEFKTLLKRMGHRVPRDFYRGACISRKYNRLFRWRWWAKEGFMVDIGEPDETFDRWANSVEVTVKAHLFLEIPKPPEATW